MGRQQEIPEVNPARLAALARAAEAAAELPPTRSASETSSAIGTTTNSSGRSSGSLGRTGTLEPGKWADVIATPLDPSQDVSRLRDVRFVMKGGVRQDLSPL